MSDAIKTISVLILSIAMMGFAYLFYLNGETFIVLVLLFIGIVSALTLVASVPRPKRRR